MRSQRIADGALPLDPGQLRDFIVIERKTITGQNDYGEDVIAWVEVCRLWCHVKAMVGRELEAMRTIHAEARFKIRSWYPAIVIQREDRARWGGRTLDILDAEDPDGVGRELVIYAREFVD